MFERGEAGCDGDGDYYNFTYYIFSRNYGNFYGKALLGPVMYIWLTRVFVCRVLQ